LAGFEDAAQQPLKAQPTLKGRQVSAAQSLESWWICWIATSVEDWGWQARQASANHAEEEDQDERC
jgi:hypothetical protein